MREYIKNKGTMCVIDSCTRDARCKKMCHKHYCQSRKLNPLSSEYSIWRGMINRCHNQNVKAYKKYGGRGIFVCDEWKSNFKSFVNDMGERPSLKHSIDRIDNDKGYSKENCRWATKSQQQRNRGVFKNNKSGHKGVCYCKKQDKWEAYISIDKKRISLGNFLDKNDAVAVRKKAETKYWQ